MLRRSTTLSPFDTSTYEACCPETGILIPPGGCCPIGASICCGLSAAECVNVIDPCSDDENDDPCCACAEETFCWNGEGLCRDITALLPTLPQEESRLEVPYESSQALLIYGSSYIVTFQPGQIMTVSYNIGGDDSSTETAILSFTDNRVFTFDLQENLVKVSTSFSFADILLPPQDRRFLVSAAQCQKAQAAKDMCDRLEEKAANRNPLLDGIIDGTLGCAAGAVLGTPLGALLGFGVGGGITAGAGCKLGLTMSNAFTAVGFAEDLQNSIYYGSNCINLPDDPRRDDRDNLLECCELGCCPEDMCWDGTCPGQQCGGTCPERNGCCVGEKICDGQCIPEDECCGVVCGDGVCCGRDVGDCMPQCGNLCVSKDSKCCIQDGSIVSNGECCPGEEDCDCSGAEACGGACCSSGYICTYRGICEDKSTVHCELGGSRCNQNGQVCLPKARVWLDENWNFLGYLPGCCYDGPYQSYVCHGEYCCDSAGQQCCDNGCKPKTHDCSYYA